MGWEQVITIILVGLAGIVAALSTFAITWLLSQSWVKKYHLEGLIQAVIPQVVDWVEWWASHWNDPNVAAPKGAVKMDKALELLKTYVPGAKAVPDEILKLKIEVAIDNAKQEK